MGYLIILINLQGVHYIVPNSDTVFIIKKITQ